MGVGGGGVRGRGEVSERNIYELAFLFLNQIVNGPARFPSVRSIFGQFLPAFSPLRVLIRATNVNDHESGLKELDISDWAIESFLF